MVTREFTVTLNIEVSGDEEEVQDMSEGDALVVVKAWLTRGKGFAHASLPSVSVASADVLEVEDPNAEED